MDIAKGILFLASDEFGYMKGTGLIARHRGMSPIPKCPPFVHIRSGRNPIKHERRASGADMPYRGRQEARQPVHAVGDGLQGGMDPSENKCRMPASTLHSRIVIPIRVG